MQLDCAGKILDLTQPQVMGVLNVTPDSFFDGGRFAKCDAAIMQARQMVAEGAALIDVGGESSRPGAAAVSVQEELDRTIPVIEAIRKEWDVIISIDTSKPEVMRAAVQAGAGMINDVHALRAEQALQTAVQLQVPVCLMHMQGEPRSMQRQPQYVDVVREVKEFLIARRDACVAAGIVSTRLLLDPGFGFGKTLQHNLQLFHHLSEFTRLGQPLLVGVSRKSMISDVLKLSVDQRLPASVALAALAVWMGARIIRAHDVAATVHAMKMTSAVMAVS
jgi:dihydropteroate synthase